MTLNLLSSADAVRAAMDEYDAIGGRAFLQKYGFGVSRGYFVARDCKLYDSKAIAGVAVGKQHPDRGPCGVASSAAATPP
jgi:5-methylcytosine-specific restriction protein A